MYKGQTYYFCAVGCKQKFDREPDKVPGRRREPDAAPDDRARAAARPGPLRALMHGRVDNTHDDAFTHTVRLADVDRALEVDDRRRALAELRDPRRALPPLPGRVAPAVTEGLPSLAGVAMVGGLTRRAAEAVGGGAGAALAVDADIEVGAARAPGGQDAARQAERAAGGRRAGVLAARHRGLGRPSGLLLRVRRPGARCSGRGRSPRP